MTDKLVPSSDALVQELRSRVEATRGHVAQTANRELVALYWQVGKRLREEVPGDERAAYGEQVVAAATKALMAEFGRGFSKRNLHYMARFAEVFPDAEIVHALRSPHRLGDAPYRGLIPRDGEGQLEARLRESQRT